MIREILPSDVNAVAGLWFRMVREAGISVHPNIGWFMTMFDALVVTPFYYGLIAIEPNGNRKDEAVGFIDGQIIPDPISGKEVIFCSNFFVMPEWRNTVVTHGLYRFAVRAIKSAGIDTIEFSPFALGRWEERDYTAMRKVYEKRI